jgi:hypothetical protein
MKKLLCGLACAGVGASHAALAGAVTAAVSSLASSVLLLFGALTVAGATVWGARVLYRHFYSFPKA